MTDPASRIIIDRPTGLWNRQASREHFAKLGLLLARQRLAYGHARLLVDLSDTLIQPQEAFGYVQSDLAAICRPGDRLAFAGGSTLLRMQKKRLELPSDVGIFDDKETAEAWLG